MRKQASFDVRVVPAAEWSELAPFLFERNVTEGLLCLHSDAGPTLEAYEADLLNLAAHEACFVVERGNGRIVGALGAQFDVDLGRAWLRGPFLAPAAAASRQADPLRAAMLERLLAAVPDNINELHALIAATHPETIDFFLRAGFEQLPSEFIYAAPRPVRPPPPSSPDGYSIEVCHPEWLPALMTLHDAEFPHPCVTHAELQQPAGAGRVTLAATRAGQALGYVHVSYDAQTNEAYLDFVAVWPFARGEGVGGALLQAALCWAFADRGADVVGFELPEAKARARSLFERAGFELQAEAVHLRLVRPRG